MITIRRNSATKFLINFVSIMRVMIVHAMKNMDLVAPPKTGKIFFLKTRMPDFGTSA